jgi:hypothetical protein
MSLDPQSSASVGAALMALAETQRALGDSTNATATAPVKASRQSRLSERHAPESWSQPQACRIASLLPYRLQAPAGFQSEGMPLC